MFEFGAGGRMSRGVEKRKKTGVKLNRRVTTRRGDLQVLLLIDPGAELGWAVLSETLPSWEAGDVCARA